MGLFSPVKKHANKFRYIPRYYDPEKERREQRRKEMYGMSSDDDGEYTPGKYIRTQREARKAAEDERNNSKRKVPSLVFLLLIAAVAIVLYMIYPTVIGTFSSSKKQTREEIRQRHEEEAWPYRNAQITKVPNDYVEPNDYKEE